MISPPELLSPGGSYEAACAALQYGADAVYAGLPAFSARADAPNITPEDLANLVRHAHSLTPRRRVHIALNTLVQDHEIPALLDAIATAADLGADALIVQDFATARLARRNFPGLSLHASTQLTAHNLHAVAALGELGFSRVILARELSLAEIAHITKNTRVEIEVFIHGALCYSYSGLCLCSSLTTSRSGNRGRCAYSCRQAFRAGDGAPAHPFSMRDLCLLQHIPQIRELPIASLKIEGRMKSPLYVAAVTDLYRRKLDNTLSPADEQQRLTNLATIFSRPTTTLYFAGETPVIDPTATGHRGALAGKVLARFRDFRGDPWLRLQTLLPLEKHDGLQVDPQSSGQPAGFAVEGIRRGKSDLFAAPANATIEIPLPPDAPFHLLNPGAPLYCSSSQAVKRAYPLQLPRVSSLPGLHPYTLRATLAPDAITLEASDSGQAVKSFIHHRASLPPAADASQTFSAFQKVFSRTHPFPFRLDALRLDDPRHLFAPPSLLNTLRRDLLQQLQNARTTALDKKLATERQYWFDDATHIEPNRTESNHSFILKIPAHLFTSPADFPDASEIILQLHHDHLAPSSPGCPVPDVGHSSLRLALPLVTRRHEEPALDDFIRRQLQRGRRMWEVPDLASLHRLRSLADGAELDITADWSFYALNRVACNQLAELRLTRRVCSPEDTLPNILGLASFPPAPEVLAFQHSPLFISETPPHAKSPSLHFTPANRALSDALAIQTRHVDGRAVTTHGEPYSALGFHRELLARGIRRFRCDFSFSPPETPFASTWRGLLSLQPPHPRRVANLERGI